MSILHGYKLPILGVPTSDFSPNDPSMTEYESNEMSKVIRTFATMGAIEACIDEPNQFISPIFLVPKSDGTNRFILNLKKLNKFIKTEHFKLEDLRAARRLATPNCYFASIDLKDAYLHIPVCQQDRKFLKFKWNEVLYQFTCLPFGLCTAPRVFTKLMKPIVNHLRNLGFLSVIYLDDLLLIGRTYDDCLKNVCYTKQTLEYLGLTINETKSVMTPCQQIKFLGFVLDSKNFAIRLPTDKSEKLFDFCSKLLVRDQTTIQDFAKFIGTAISCCPAVPYGIAHTKILEQCKTENLRQNSENFYAKMQLSEQVKSEILWWKRNCLNNSHPIQLDKYELTITTDASKSGWGAWSGAVRSHGFWSDAQKQESINYLELLAAYYGLRCFASEKSNTNILLRLDNTTAIAYINRMGGVRYKHLNNLARTICSWCEKRKIFIFASYISSSDNYIADKESRIKDFNSEWSINKDCLKSLFHVLEYTPEIDLFASNQNTKCTRFFSWKPDPYSEAVDAFTVSWENLKLYAFPPFSLLPRVLQKLQVDNAEGLVIAPNWPTQPWFPVFMQLLKSKPFYLHANDHRLSFCSKQHPLGQQLTLVAGILSGKSY